MHQKVANRKVNDGIAKKFEPLVVRYFLIILFIYIRRMSECPIQEFLVTKTIVKLSG